MRTLLIALMVSVPASGAAQNLEVEFNGGAALLLMAPGSVPTVGSALGDLDASMGYAADYVIGTRLTLQVWDRLGVSLAAAVAPGDFLVDVRSAGDPQVRDRRATPTTYLVALVSAVYEPAVEWGNPEIAIGAGLMEFTDSDSLLFPLRPALSASLGATWPLFPSLAFTTRLDFLFSRFSFSVAYPEYASVESRRGLFALMIPVVGLRVTLPRG